MEKSREHGGKDMESGLLKGICGDLGNLTLCTLPKNHSIGCGSMVTKTLTAASKNLTLARPM